MLPLSPGYPERSPLASSGATPHSYTALMFALSLPNIPLHRIRSNKLKNLKLLSSSSTHFGFESPATIALLDEHFVQTCLLNQIPLGQITPDLSSRAQELSSMLLSRQLPDDTRSAIQLAFETLSSVSPLNGVSARSCCDVEDGHGSSFSGVFDSIHSAHTPEQLEEAVKRVYASVFSPRAIEHYLWLGLSEIPIMSVAFQPTLGGTDWFGGVVLTQSPDLSPLPLLLVSLGVQISEVTSGAALSEDYLLSRTNVSRSLSSVIVQSISGTDTIDHFRLDENSARTLATLSLGLEDRFMDHLEIEWVCDPQGKFHLLQAKRIPAHSPDLPLPIASPIDLDPICTGLPVGTGQVSAELLVVDTLEEAIHAPSNRILVTESTDPDWTTVVHRAAAVVTRYGSRASHVARTARESGVLALVGCGQSITALRSGDIATLLCSEGVFAAVYPGSLDHRAWAVELENLTVQSVSAGLSASRASSPALVTFDASRYLTSLRFPDLDVSLTALSNRQIQRIAGYDNARQFVTAKLAESLSLIAIAFSASQITITLDEIAGSRRLISDVIRICRERLCLENVQLFEAESTGEGG